MSCDSTSENTRQAITTAAITLKIWPMRPPISIIGANATTVVSTPKITGIATSWVPLMAAASRPSPRCWWV